MRSEDRQCVHHAADTRAGGGIARGIALSAAGDQVNVAPGTFNEDVDMLAGAKPGLKLIGSGTAVPRSAAPLAGGTKPYSSGRTRCSTGSRSRGAGPGENNIGVTVETGSTGAIIRNNHLTGNRTAVYLNGGNSQASITRNVIDGNRTGILLPDGTGYGAYQITENAIVNNQTFGVIFATPTALNAGLTIRGNNVTGNYASQLENDSGSIVNASANWFGAAQPIVSSAQLNGNLPPEFAYPGPVTPPSAPYPYTISGNSAGLVDYSPTLNSGTDIDAATPGFQGDFSVLNVLTGGIQSGTASRIQEGIDAAATGGTVHVQSGSYGGFNGTGKTFTLDPQGIVSAIGPVKLAAGNTLAIDIAGTTPSHGYDQLAVTGTVDVTGATLSPAIVGGFQLEYGMNFSPITNDSTDPITGEFANFPTGTSVPVGGRLLKAGYAAGTGNDVQLTVAVVDQQPRPGHDSWNADSR